MTTSADVANLTKALKGIDQSIRGVSLHLKQLVKVAEALQQDIAQVGRMMKEKESSDGSE